MMHIDMSSDPTMATTKTKASGSARQKNNAETLPPAPMLGAQFREAREARNLTLDAVADELMIRKYYLQALEEGAYRNLPERVYSIGFVQNYSQLLGMDTDALTEQFKREAYGSRGAANARVELNMPTPASQSMLPSRPAIFAVGGLLLILIIGGIVWGSNAPDKTATSIPQPPVNADSDMIPAQPDIVSQPAISDQDGGFAAPTAAPVPETTAIVSGAGTVTTTDPASVPAVPAPADASVTAQPAAVPADAAKPADPAKPAAEEAKPAAAVTTAPTTATAAPAGTRILIEALEPSWVEIADGDGNILYTNILRVGQALPIPNKPGVTLTTGNASGIQIVLDGKKLGPLGGKGDVKRAISLDPEKLSKR